MIQKKMDIEVLRERSTLFPTPSSTSTITFINQTVSVRCTILKDRDTIIPANENHDPPSVGVLDFVLGTKVYFL